MSYLIRIQGQNCTVVNVYGEGPDRGPYDLAQATEILANLVGEDPGLIAERVLAGDPNTISLGD